VYDSSSKVYRLFDAFIKLYVRYGCDAKLAGFAKDMIGTIDIVYDEKKTSSFFRLLDRHMCINEYTKGMQGDFERLAVQATDWCRLNVHIGNLLNRDMVELGVVGNTKYLEYFGFGVRGDGATVIHEIEHARRKNDCTAWADSPHGDWTGVLMPTGAAPDNTQQTLTYETCQVRTYRAIACHSIDGVPFFVALVREWANLQTV
jgi:hypothetical protein